jgi:hypothetical protein
MGMLWESQDFLFWVISDFLLGNGFWDPRSDEDRLLDGGGRRHNAVKRLHPALQGAVKSLDLMGPKFETSTFRAWLWMSWKGHQHDLQLLNAQWRNCLSERTAAGLWQSVHPFKALALFHVTKHQFHFKDLWESWYYWKAPQVSFEILHWTLAW